jgi:thiol-disulfide isomerase/thioredoxin
MFIFAFGACMPVLVLDGSEEWIQPANDWCMNPPPEETVEEGFRVGQTPLDLRMKDQKGQDVSLWQFYGKVILLDVSAEWCAPCKLLAEETEHTFQDYREDGLMYLTLLAEDEFSQLPNQEILEDWANDFAITAPVLSDTIDHRPQLVPTGAYPRLILINQDLKIEKANITPAEDAKIREEIEKLLY